MRRLTNALGGGDGSGLPLPDFTEGPGRRKASGVRRKVWGARSAPKAPDAAQGVPGGADGRPRGRDAGPKSAQGAGRVPGSRNRGQSGRGAARPLGRSLRSPLGLNDKAPNPCKVGRYRQRKEARTAKHTTCVAADSAYIPPLPGRGGAKSGTRAASGS